MQSGRARDRPRPDRLLVGRSGHMDGHRARRPIAQFESCLMLVATWTVEPHRVLRLVAVGSHSRSIEALNGATVETGERPKRVKPGRSEDCMANFRQICRPRASSPIRLVLVCRPWRELQNHDWAGSAGTTIRAACRYSKPDGLLVLAVLSDHVLAVPAVPGPVDSSWRS